MSHCKVIAICIQKGGVGKTTICVNLGVGNAQQSMFQSLQKRLALWEICKAKRKWVHLSPL